MTHEQGWLLISMSARTVWVGFMLATIFGVWSPIFRNLAAELQPFVVPSVLLCQVASDIAVGDPLNGWRLFDTIMQLYFYWRARNNDDDRWKRRRRKLASKVAQVAGRLVVVPVKAGA